MKNFKDKLLEYYGLTEESYLAFIKPTSIDDIYKIKDYKDAMACSEFIKKAIKDNKKILIYGDYDCDGVMSTSILYLTLKTSAFTPGFYIPFRETDGYGVTKENIDKFYSLGYKLIILIDNGITLNEQVDYANSLGIDVIIMDHHTLQDKLPNAKYILHPVYSEFSKDNMCAGSVAFFFSKVYLGIVDEYLLTLAMISTLSDQMPLVNLNRLLVVEGLKALNKNKYYNILKLINKDAPVYNENDINMSVAPKINAIGRIITDNSLYNIVRYFIRFDDIDFVNKTAEWIDNTNSYRKQMVTDLLQNKSSIDINNNSIIIVKDDMKEGLAGLLAARFMDEYEKPTVVFVKENNDSGIYKGSIRSKNGFDVNIILDDLKDILETHGGHQNAGGLTIKEENFDKFKERFENAATKHQFIPEDKDLIDITINDINKENYDLINSLSPFGQEHRAPEFIIKNVKTNFLKTNKDGKHIITRLNPTSAIIYFNYKKDIFSQNLVDLIGYYAINYFNNYFTIQFHVTDFIKH